MKYLKFFYGLVLMCLLMSPLFGVAQTPVIAPKTTTSAAEDTLVTVDILPGVRKLEIRKVNDSTQLQILVGNVRLKQGTSLFFCDSCVINNNTNTFEAWGNVHINDSDTTDIYSNHLLYLIKRKLAYLDGNVKLTDGKGVLTTPDLEYDMNTSIGIYKHGGKVVKETTVLTSREGYYYADLKDVYFKQNVELKDPNYYLKTDSLLFNTDNSIARFIAETFIRDSTGRTINTKEGFYNLKSGEAQFGRNPEIKDGTLTITGNDIRINDSMMHARGNVVIRDTVQNTTLVAGEVQRNNKTDAILATRKPLMIVKQENDSIYITADTLFSARLTDLPNYRELNEAKRSVGIGDTTLAGIPIDTAVLQFNDSVPVSKNEKPLKEAVTIKDTVPTKGNTPPLPEKPIVPKSNQPIVNAPIARDTMIVKDTITGVKVVTADDAKDSTNRYFEAYRNVRIFSDSMQAVSDSAFYSFRDSTFRLYQNPVVWAKESQVTGDTLLLFTKNKKPHRFEVFEHSFVVNRSDEEVYNQVKSTRMDGYFIGGTIDSVRAAGFAECIYYIQDEDSAYTGVNESKCDIMDIYFIDQGLQKVVFRSSVTGTLWPIKQKSPSEMRLPDFRWLEARRPKTKYEMFE